LKELEDKNKLKCIITQNIDGLHSKAKSKNVLEIHGSIYRNYCTKCHTFYDAEYVFKAKDIPICKCGALIKPDIVLYEEPLNDSFDKAIDYISKCDTLIIAGTSLTVYPAANLIRYFKGKNLILINKDKTSYDELATIHFNQNMSDIFKEL
jgi:NAD-dependent deacetylase